MNTAAISRLLTVFVLVGSCSSLSFSEEFTINWSEQNIAVDNATGNVQVSLTEEAGAQFSSKSSFLSGFFTVRIKFIEGESAGTLSSFYLTSMEEKQDEIDFEFLGNLSGQPYIVHTNIFVKGVGGREQRAYLWFDPTTDFHTYSVLWNHQQIVWSVDEIPIRIYKKSNDSTSLSFYPYTKPMYVTASLYDASSWATHGGRIRTNWTYAPFKLNFRNFTFKTCEVPDGNSSSCTENASERSKYQSLTPTQMIQLKKFQQSYMIYDYCTDTSRYSTPPTECAFNVV